MRTFGAATTRGCIALGRFQAHRPNLGRCYAAALLPEARQPPVHGRAARSHPPAPTPSVPTSCSEFRGDAEAEGVQPQPSKPTQTRPKRPYIVKPAPCAAEPMTQHGNLPMCAFQRASWANITAGHRSRLCKIPSCSERPSAICCHKRKRYGRRHFNHKLVDPTKAPGNPSFPNNEALRSNVGLARQYVGRGILASYPPSWRQTP